MNEHDHNHDDVPVLEGDARSLLAQRRALDAQLGLQHAIADALGRWRALVRAAWSDPTECLDDDRANQPAEVERRSEP